MVRQTRIHIHNLVLHQMRDASKHQTPSSFSPQSEVLQTQLIHHREWVFRVAAMCLSAHRYGSYVRLACHLLLADGLTPFLCPFSFSLFFSSWLIFFLVWESPSNTVGSWQSWWIQQAAVRPASFIARVFLSLRLCCFYPFLSTSPFLFTWFSLCNKITLIWLCHTSIYPVS